MTHKHSERENMKNMVFRTIDYITDQEMIALIADELIADTKKTHDMYFSYDTIDAPSHHKTVVSFNEEPNQKSPKTTIKLSDLSDPQSVGDILLEEISDEITKLNVDLLVSTSYYSDSLHNIRKLYSKAQTLLFVLAKKSSMIALL